MRRPGNPVTRIVLGVAAALCGPLVGAGADQQTIGIPHTCGAYYPPALQQQGIEGTTLLAFRVTRYGTVRQVTVSESSGNKDLDTAAVLCAQRWKYKPATSEGKPVEVHWAAKVVWRIAEPSSPATPAAKQ